MIWESTEHFGGEKSDVAVVRSTTPRSLTCYNGIKIYTKTSKAVLCMGW